jgi:hypothetical protein
MSSFLIPKGYILCGKTKHQYQVLRAGSNLSFLADIKIDE